MINLLERYLWKHLIISILITWVSLVCLDSFFNFLQELGDTGGDHNYGKLQALSYIIYKIPGSFYEFSVTAILIGSLMALGQLAASSEIIAMRAAGVSIRNIIFSTLKLGMLLGLIIFALGEWLSPKFEIKAKGFKLEKKEKKVAYTQAGVWVKQKNQIIHIDRAWTNDKLSGISIFEIDTNKGDLHKVTKAEEAIRENDIWQMRNVFIRHLSEDGIKVETHQQMNIPSLVSTKIMNITSIEPQHLSTSQLTDYISHQEENSLNTLTLQQSYWQRFSLPLSALVMLLIAIPFALGSQRSAGAGQRLFIGIILGITFYLINRAMGHMGVVYGFSPLISAFLPLLLFLSLGIVMLKQIR